MAKTAVVAGTWAAVSNRVSRRQAGRWAAENQSSEQPKPNPYMPPPPGRYQRAMFQPHAQPQPPVPAYVAAPEPEPAPPPSVTMSAKLAQLQQLGDLKTQGIVTEEEFQTQKDKILNG